MENEINVGDSIDVINAKLRTSTYAGRTDAELERLLTDVGFSLSLFTVVDGQLVHRD